ncbi:putative carboxylesterase 11 [Vitis vinifera]|uniref:Putative carboxylesterase 11 n=1 Tax=Vitis vinifera TaxID=29760 RepID=A0A438H7K5_VITVI|nr:putative carboxylesterase 11 [Vitis vinifera]
MPTVAVKLYSVFFKFLLKHRLQNRIQTPSDDNNQFGVTSRPEESIAAANPSFVDGVATKDIHIDPFTSLSVRIFLPDTCLVSPELDSKGQLKSRVKAVRSDRDSVDSNANPCLNRRNSYGAIGTINVGANSEQTRRISYGCSSDAESLNLRPDSGVYRGYSPSLENCRKLPLMLQFHGGGFVSGSNDSVANDFFCRRIAKLCDVIVVAVGYRLAPENRYPAAFEDGLKVLNWLGKQANLAECNKVYGKCTRRRPELKKSDVTRHIADTFGASMVEPWLAAHGDPSRCVLLGVSCGANIADYVARKACRAREASGPCQGGGTGPDVSFLHWNLDHPAANPLIPDREPPLKLMPPTLTVVAEHDWMRDRAIAYSAELRKVNVDSPVLEYKDAVHEFATLDMLLKTPQAQACAEDIAIWVKKYISFRGVQLRHQWLQFPSPPDHLVMTDVRSYAALSFEYLEATLDEILQSCLGFQPSVAWPGKSIGKIELGYRFWLLGSQRVTNELPLWARR